MATKANTITTLRDHLFKTLEALQDKENPLDIERAKAVTDVAQAIINTAKVEVDHMRVTGAGSSGFIPDSSSHNALPSGTTSPQPGVLVHWLRG
jgi:hypothetical protein